MTIEFAKFLADATNHCGSQDVDVRENYSGRAMYGSETAAVVVDNVSLLLPDVVQYIKETAEAMTDSDAKTFIEGLPDCSEMGQLRTDSMGRGVVIY
jgi:hypothetical protein